VNEIIRQKAKRCYGHEDKGHHQRESHISKEHHSPFTSPISRGNQKYPMDGDDGVAGIQNTVGVGINELAHTIAFGGVQIAMCAGGIGFVGKRRFFLQFSRMFTQA
jgi:hypothetical protein